MLLKKFRDMKKKPQTNLSTSEDTIQSMRNWVRKIEQSVSSISSRLAAVEKRLSIGKTKDSSEPFVLDGTSEVHMEQVMRKLKNVKKNKELYDVVKIITHVLSVNHEELLSQQQEISSCKNQLHILQESLTETLDHIKQSSLVGSETISELADRMQSLERHEPLLMRLGKLEIPIEITGIIGGILAFLIAVLVWLDQKAVLLSPWFLACIGVVLIGSAVLKTFHLGSAFDKPWKTLSPIDHNLREKQP